MSCFSFDGKKKRGGTKDFNEKQRLVHKYKQEFKGAVREIRKDNEFLTRIKIKEQMERWECFHVITSPIYCMIVTIYCTIVTIYCTIVNIYCTIVTIYCTIVTIYFWDNC